jgi:CRP-like cAMP-binding protein
VPDFGNFGNQVLDGLAAEQRLTLSDYLEEVVLERGELLAAKGQPVGHVHFPIDALASLFAGGEHEERIEAVSIGRNGLTAPNVVLGDTTALGDTVVQLGGRAWRISTATLLQLSANDSHLRNYLVAHVCLALREIMDVCRSVGRLTITARLARWLARASGSVGSLQLSITHSALAEILAVRRPSVTLGLQMLESYGLIRSTRRSIVVRDLDGLIALGKSNGRALPPDDGQFGTDRQQQEEGDRQQQLAEN